jgi:hypothetical protein
MRRFLDAAIPDSVSVRLKILLLVGEGWFYPAVASSA